ncbi:mucin-2-like [Triplophysa rosa]|uniref:mucin-2-like n=1 Tax=Triplophysa rosa TaxID=992332 RepID=UPI002545EFE5|nr:mucin-2-like [Triplophysa rosa]
MASKEDAKRQKFYDIECVLDDCDDEDGYKPLSDSDELNESAEEDELREEGVDSSEEWEPVIGRSVAKRQQRSLPSSSVPRRRGRPRKHPPQPIPIATGRSLPIHSLYSSPKPQGRGRPPNDKSKITLMSIPTRYPTIIPKPVPFSTPLPNPLCTLTFSPNSTFFHSNQPSNSTPIHTPNPTSVAFCQNSTHVPPPDAGPSVTFTSNSTPIHTSDPTPSDTFSPNSTHVSYSTPITTLICMPSQTGRLFDTNTIKITDSWTEKQPLDEKLDSVKECVASSERETSPTVIAKRQRLSSPSPPAITPVRRRGRPRKHPPKILPNSNVEPVTVSSLTNEPPNTSKSTNEFANISDPTNEPATATNEPATATNLTNEPATVTNEPATVTNLTNEPATVTNEPATATNEPATATNEPATVTNEPATVTNEPATATNLTNEPATATNEPATVTNEPATATNLTNEPADASNHTADLATTSNQTPVGSLADRGLDENKNSVEIIDSDEEDLWEDCVECAEDWKPLSVKPLKNISKRTSPQLRDVSSESKSKPAPAATVSSSDHQPTPRRRGRPPKRKKPIPKSAFTPFHTPSKPKHAPNPVLLSPHTSAVDLSRVKSENGPELDQWHDVTIKDEEPVLPDFSPKRPPGPQLTDTPRSPLHSFQLFFSSSVVQTIVRNTNSYAERRAEAGKTLHWVPLTASEFYSFLALVLYMGLVKVDTLLDYWARKTVYSFPYPQSVMSRERFLAIFSNLYLCDPQDDIENIKKRATPGYDRLLKIKPLYTDMISACRTHFHPNREISVDERTRFGLKRHATDMPNTLGYKLFVLFDSSSGYNWNFFVYEGKSSTSGKGVGYDAVMRLLDVKLLGKGYRLYTDTFYTSPTLFRHLLRNDIVSCGLLRHTSGLLEDYAVSRRADRGSIRWCRRGPLLFVKWTNISEIVTCSTMHKAFAGDFISRSVRGAGGERTLHHIPIPPPVKDCNEHMGGDDLTDALFGYDNILYKTRKWYKTFFFHFLEIAVVNSYALHRHVTKAPSETPLSQKAFREALISELEGDGKGEKLSASEPVTPPVSPVRTEQCLPEYFQSDAPLGRRLCAMCRLSGTKVTTAIFCSRCRVALCCVASRNCFKKWHYEGHSHV